MSSNSDREYMSSVDYAWLRMDRPYNHMTINAVMILADRLDLENLKQHIEHTWLGYKRFKQLPVSHPTGTYWETDTHFELGSHIRRIGLPGARGKEELEEFVSNLVSTPMDPTKPLWDINLVEDYRGGSALILRIHHCYADGIALMHVLLSMTTATASEQGVVKTSPLARKKTAPEEDETLGDIFWHLVHPVGEAVGHAVKAGKDLLEEGVDLVLHPAETMDYARQGIDLASSYARQGLGLAAEMARLLLLSDEPQTRFRGKLGVTKRVAWAEPLPLNEVRLVGRALGCTINDVLLASVAGALRSYMLDRGDAVDSGMEIRAAVPVNLRPLEQAENLGNVFGLVLLTLPIGIENPVERLYEVHRRMGELREGHQAILTFLLLEGLGLGPRIVQAQAMHLLSKKATAVMTNVPGPEYPLYFCGCYLNELMFWVPQSGSVGMGVSIQSYNGRVHFGLITDQKLVKDPEAIIERFIHEFEKLVLLTMMGPWDKHPDAGAIENSIQALAAR